MSSGGPTFRIPEPRHALASKEGLLSAFRVCGPPVSEEDHEFNTGDVRPMPTCESTPYLAVKQTLLNKGPDCKGAVFAKAWSYK